VTAEAPAGAPGRAAGPGFLDRFGDADRTRTGLLIAAGVAAMAAITFAGPVRGPTGLLLTAMAVAVGLGVLGSPTMAVLVLLLASFLRNPVQIPGLPAEPMVLVLCALCVSAAVAGLRGTIRFRFGWLEAAMAAYLAWNIISMVWPHSFSATLPGTGQSISVYRFILTGTAVPFIAYVVGRAVYRGEDQVRRLLLLLLVLAGYSGATSIVQFTGPAALVWPSYILDSPVWPGRAVGIFNQPAVNGLVMVAGFVTAMFLLWLPNSGWPMRVAALLCAGVCVPGIYLTYTRAVWLVFGVSLVFCALFAKGARTGFVVTIVVALLFLGGNWASFTSSDRRTGGIGSTDEVYDRLNTIETSLWAIQQKPLTGWGISRFTQVNTYYHQVWDQSVSFAHGYGISSHENELGIAVELGLPGLALWLAVLVLLVVHLYQALRDLPVHGLCGRALALLALSMFATYLVCGFTIDLRFHDFANLIVFLLAGVAIGSADRVRSGDRTPVAGGSGGPTAAVLSP
jgi:O-antigen ligase